MSTETGLQNHQVMEQSCTDAHGSYYEQQYAVWELEKR